MNTEISVTKASSPEQHAKNVSEMRVRELRPAIDVLASGDEYRVLIDVPGVAPEDVDVHLDMSELKIEARRSLGDETIHYRKALRLPQTIDVETLKAELRNGVLEVRMSRRESAKARRIEVRSAS